MVVIYGLTNHLRLLARPARRGRPATFFAMHFEFSLRTQELIVNRQRLTWEKGVGTKHCRFVHYPCPITRYQGYEHWYHHERSRPVCLLQDVPVAHLPWLTQHTPFHFSYLYNDKCIVWHMQPALAEALAEALSGGGGWAAGRPVLLQVVPDYHGGSVSSACRHIYQGYLSMNDLYARPRLCSVAPMMAYKQLAAGFAGRDVRQHYTEIVARRYGGTWTGNPQRPEPELRLELIATHYTSAQLRMLLSSAQVKHARGIQDPQQLRAELLRVHASLLPRALICSALLL
jgi:hypothetical protein